MLPEISVWFDLSFTILDAFVQRVSSRLTATGYFKTIALFIEFFYMITVTSLFHFCGSGKLLERAIDIPLSKNRNLIVLELVKELLKDLFIHWSQRYVVIGISNRLISMYEPIA